MTEQIMTDDETGPLAGLGDDYLNNLGGMPTDSPRQDQQATPPHNALRTNGDPRLQIDDSASLSVTDRMDTDVSLAQYHTQRLSGSARDMPASLEHRHSVVSSRPSAPVIREDSWSRDTVRDDAGEQLDTLSSLQQSANGTVPPPNNAVNLALQPSLTTTATAGRRISATRSRAALAPLPSRDGIQRPNVEGTPFPCWL